jgi:PST family polysaccharide transporter
MTLTAGLTFFQISLDNVLTAAMALMGYGVWAAVAPKIVVAILWTIIVLLTVDPRPRAKITRAKLWDVIAYSRRVLGAESLNTFRANADKMIVGKFLGMEANGIFWFAANNGSGIATGLSTAIGQAVLPYLARGEIAAADLERRFWNSVRAMSFVIMPIILLQVILAPWYVPLIFGEKWLPAVPALMLMCLGALSRPIVVATSQLLRAVGAVDLEWRIAKYNAVLFVLALVAGLPFGVVGVAAALAVVNIIPAMIFARAALERASADRAAAPSSNLAEAAA